MKALVRDGQVVEVFEEVVLVDGRPVPLAERLHPDVLALLVPYAPPAGTELALPSAEALAAATIARLTVVVQQWLDTTARGDDFDHIGSAVSYADEPAVPSFQLLGRRYRKWRSVVWAACYQVLDEWRAGERAEPTAESLLAELPAFDTITVD